VDLKRTLHTTYLILPFKVKETEGRRKAGLASGHTELVGNLELEYRTNPDQFSHPNSHLNPILYLEVDSVVCHVSFQSI
jgi:hypothetical protein